MNPPTKRNLIFRAIGHGYEPGDERPYDVLVRGQVIGTVERDWLVSARPGGEPTLGWSFSGQGRIGEGRTRAAAVLAAWS